MHTTVLGLQLRTAVLGTRISATGLAPFTVASPAGCSLPRSTTKSYSTVPATKPASKRSTTLSSPTTNKARPSAKWNLSTKFSCQQHQSVTVLRIPASATIRHNSTASSQASANKKASASPRAAAADGAPLDWNTFFQLRASRRRYSLVSSILTALASTAVGVQVLSSQDLDAMGTQIMGLDPFIVLGLATAACGAIGWLAGPVVGNGVWGLVNRRFRSSFAKKEKEFYNRIKRYRVDPSSNTLANPVPDYYGEKIGSVQGYRQWLKDQRAYNRKRRSFIL